MLLGVRNQGGIRVKAPETDPPYIVLVTTGREPDWPDSFDATTGHLVYFGDNRRPGHGLLEVRGNRVIDAVYRRLWAHERHLVPPFFVFEQLVGGRDVRFVGVAAPGDERLAPGEALVPRWYLHDEGRFQNLEAHLTVLDIGRVSRAWIDQLQRRDRSEEPEAWSSFVDSGRYRALRTRPLEQRWPPKAEQLPDSGVGMAVLTSIHRHFSADPFAFETFAGKIFEWHRPGIVGRIDFTRPYRDGGRDAVGDVIAGISEPTVIGSFALEAKFGSLQATAARIESPPTVEVARDHEHRHATNVDMQRLEPA